MEVEKRDDEIQQLLQAHKHTWNQTYNFINSMSLKCAIELGIPDIIHKHAQPIKLSQLISQLHIHPTKSHAVHRLMAILTHSGFFTQHKASQKDEDDEGDPEEAYMLTDACKILVKDSPYSMVPYLLLSLDPIQMKPWQYLSTWFHNEVPTTYETAHGMAIWEYASKEGRLNSLFNNAMLSDSRLVSRVVIEKCKWAFEGLESVVDAGGGIGTLAKAIAQCFPNLECTVLDLPHVVAGLQGTTNLKFVEGDMFQAIPPADAVLLKSILHDWGDEECVKILKKCKEAISGNSKRGNKVIIIDMVITEEQKEKELVQTKLCLDMLMMVLANGKERKEKEWAKLFFSAGFRDYKINSILGLRSLIELYP
ncbi:putative O-methyltransferase 3 [Senna tora]|uniref:isoflavone 7-O-methyltransferase n=1 Tax=Senna tora TaxID=362788 RepID=A0A834TKG6_9FABA|nr:putative O-methyltransferase 3 [Senna tora]